MAMRAVRLTVVSSELEAETICSMLRAEGIECGLQRTDVSGAGWGPQGWTEVLVAESDLARAEELLGADAEAE
jgi:hypothetical protein